MSDHLTTCTKHGLPVAYMHEYKWDDECPLCKLTERNLVLEEKIKELEGGSIDTH